MPARVKVAEQKRKKREKKKTVEECTCRNAPLLPSVIVFSRCQHVPFNKDKFQQRFLILIMASVTEFF